MRRLLFVSLVCVSALAQAAPRNWAKAACEDDLDSCRESCTIANGTDLESQGRLARCAQQCREESERCTFKRFQARRALNAPRPAPPAPPAPAPSSTVAMQPSPVPGVKPPSAPPSASAQEDDPWSVVKPAPPPDEGTHLATPRADPRPDTVPAQAAPPKTAEAPLHPADSVDVFLQHSTPASTEALHVQPSSSHPTPAPTPLPPAKKDLSKWDPGALE